MTHRPSHSRIGRRDRRAMWPALLASTLTLVTSFTSSGCDSDGCGPGGCGPDASDEPSRFVVGTAAYEWVDEARPEPFTEAADDHRIVPVRAWYPADATGAERAPYFLGALQAELTAASIGLPPDTFASLQVSASIDAPLAASLPDDSSPFPVLIFSPGMSTPPEFYSYQLADLASRGYVVFALGHPYATGNIVFSDGSVAPELPEMPADDARDRSIATWSLDQRFVLSRVQELALPGSGDRMAGRIDLAQVGVFGHSRGGAAAAQSCLEDARFAACADLDGSVSTVVLETPPSRPFLLMRSELNDVTLDPFFARLAGPAHQIRIAGAGHNSFSDLPRVVRDLQLPLDPEDMLLGSLAAERTFEINAAYLDAFFSAELRAASDDWFFEPPPFEEVEVTHGGSFTTGR